MVVIGVIIVMVVCLLGGFLVRPRPLRPPAPGRRPGPVALPDGLPAPVARFYRELSIDGRRIRPVDTVVVWGRARMRRAPLPWLPVTFWSEHQVGYGSEQLIAITWYGRPVLRGVDRFVNGQGELIIGWRRVIGPEIDQGENLFRWAVLALLPGVLSAHRGASWEAVDESSARLRMPFAGGTDEMVFRFASGTGLITEAQARRYREVGGAKLGWRIGYHRWVECEAGLFPSRITVTWLDSGRPWFVLDVDGVAVNVPVSAQLRAGTSDPARR